MVRITVQPRIMFLALLLALLSMGNLPAFDVQAHRGGRDLYPENTMTAFLHAASLGVTTLELDVALTADDVVVVSHDPYLSNTLVRTDKGRYVSEYPKILIKDLTFEELQTYRVGKIKPFTSYARSHRNQESVPDEHIPSLQELFETMDEHGYGGIRYNIEIKTYPDFPEYTKTVPEIVEAVLQGIMDHGKADLCTIQSFDWRSLTLVNEQYPSILTACLTAADLTFEGYSFNLQYGKPGPSPWLAGFDADEYPSACDLAAAFGADIISPRSRDISEEDVKRAHELGLLIIPWTVNSPETMGELISWGVDGIITDRPDILLSIINR